MIKLKTVKEKTAINCADLIKKYFNNIDYESYMRANKLEQISSFPEFSKSYGPQNFLFDDFTMSPDQMSFRIETLSNYEWFKYVNIISSHINSEGLNGRELKLGVLETNTNKWIGFIRVSSPLINMKPRNDLLRNKRPDLTQMNRHILNGQTIVPAQPFGFNYLGGKLLALICSSHWLRKQFDKKFNTDILMFETTSLYGNSKALSQYDGLKPFIRNKGLTDSKFVPLIQGDLFKQVKETIKNEVGYLCKETASNRKLKIQTKCFQIIKNSLPKNKKVSFLKTLKVAEELNEQKRYYVSNYGFSNYIDIINQKSNQLIKDQNYDKHRLNNLIAWWKTKATKRFENIKSENRLRNEQEVWTENKQIQIIR
jgi:hypothetical protein